MQMNEKNSTIDQRHASIMDVINYVIILFIYRQSKLWKSTLYTTHSSLPIL